MADIPLFDLTSDGKFRLAYDRLQWILQRRVTQARRSGPRAGEPSYTGIWFVGRKKRTIAEAFEHWSIDLTPDAREQYDALPESYPLFRNQVWRSDGVGGYEHVGWHMPYAVAAVEGAAQRDLALSGQLPHGTASMRWADSTPGTVAVAST